MDKKITTLSCSLLALVFIFTSLDKLVHYEGFVRALHSYAVIPESFPRYIAMAIILAELVIGIGLLRRAWRGIAALAAACLLLVFTAALTVNYWVNPDAICGCWFSITLGRGTGQHIVQNLIMAVLAVVIFLAERFEENSVSELRDLANGRA